jgi:two-component system, chemotaxis family, protein-glutamate methylesterase/glutaminase
MTYELIVIGTSWGGLNALSRLLADLPPAVEQPIVVAQHRAADSPEGGLAHLLQTSTTRIVRDAEDKERLERDHVYLAPPDYHLLVERGSLALSTDDVVQYARPSIDVLFETAADAYRERVIGIILTGANDDGAAGLARIKQFGGVALVQDPESSERRRMPDAALETTAADAVLPIGEMGKFLFGLCYEGAAERPVRDSGPVEGARGNREVPPLGSATP